MDKKNSAIGLVLATFTSPLSALREAADARRWLLPVVIATVLSGLFAGVALPRIDFATTIADALDASPAAAKMSPHDRKQAIETGSNVGAISTVAGGLVGPVALMLFVAFAFWIGFKVADGKPGFVPTLSVIAHGMLPLSLKTVLTLPALLQQEAVPAEKLENLLPSSLAAFLPEADAIGVAFGLLSAFDLFALWSLGLVVIGMAHVAGVSKVRSVLTSLVLWGAYVAVFHVALPSLGGAGR